MTKALDCDVVVIGAGAAGLAATKDLCARGVKAICVEAGSRIGGRIHTDLEIFGVPFDIGAHWLHNREVNPFVEIGMAQGLDLYPMPFSGFTKGDDPEGTALWAEAEEMGTAFSKAARAGKDVAASDVVALDTPWSLSAGLMQILPMGRDLHEISTTDYDQAFEGENWFCREGYGTVFARFHAKTPVRLNTAARKVTTGAERVIVETTDGALAAKAVIVTVSQAVLASEAIRFDPPLESDHIRAIETITLGDYNHIALMFEEGAIEAEDDAWVTYQIDEFEEGTIKGGAFLCNVGGTPLCVFETGGAYSRALQEAGQDVAIDTALQAASDVFGSQITKRFVKCHATAWRHDPLVRGSYSGAMPGHADKRPALRKPHTERVFFAGEATHLSEQATVSGAHKEGLRAARAALDVIG